MAGAAYGGSTPAAGTQSGTPVTVTFAAETPGPVHVLSRTQTYLDITFLPSTHLTAGSTYTIDLGTLGDEFTLSGVGAAGLTIVTAVDLGGNIWRFLLTGSFAPGSVNIVFDLTAFSDNSGRGPPPDDTTITQSFRVVGATADVVRSVPDNPSTSDTDESKTVALAGATIGRDLLNALRYLEIRFLGSSGFGIDHATINGDEIEFRAPDGTLIALFAPVRVGTSDIYRYGFSGTLVAGRYTVTILAGRFADLGGTLNSAETESLTLTSPTTSISNPGPGSVVDKVEYANDLNGRGWIDITFAGTGPGTKGLDAASITDADAEFTLTDGAGDLVVVGAGMLVSGTTYRFFFTGYTTGTLTVTFLDFTWRDLDGTLYSSASATPKRPRPRLRRLMP